MDFIFNNQRKKNMYSDKLDISIVIPVYNAEKCIAELYNRIVNVFEQLSLSFEMIMIEDCGQDNSWNIIEELASNDNRLTGLKLSRNFGQHHAITAGIDHVRGERTIVMDCDLQDNPEDIVKLLKKMDEGYDMVIARTVERHDTFLKRVTSDYFYKTLSWLSGTHYEKGARVFRVMSRDVVNSLKLLREQTRGFGPLTEWVGYNRI
jgi:polyisoprenyl-phosphate glycosyltransferase